MPHHALRAAVVVAGCLSTVPVYAAPEDTGSALVYGPLTVSPRLRTEVAYDDNIFTSAEGVQGSRVTRVSPTVDARIALPDKRYSLSYEGEVGRYAASSADNYDDHRFSGDAELALARRHKVKLEGDYSLQHQSRGSGLTQGFDPETGISQGFDPDGDSVDEPDRLNVAQMGGEYHYGAPRADGRLKFAAGLRDTAFQNHRSRTRYRDYDLHYGSATYYHRVLPATELLFEVSTAEIDYDVDYPGDPSLNSSEIRYLVGATWDITDITTGTVKLGQVRKDFADDAREDFSGFDWEANVTWSPRSYSQFQLMAAREEEETYGEGDFIDAMRYSLSWSHGWTDVLETRLRASYLDESYHGVERDQHTMDYGVALIYQWRRWLALELGADFSDSDSNIDWLMYDRNVIRVGATLSL